LLGERSFFCEIFEVSSGPYLQQLIRAMNAREASLTLSASPSIRRRGLLAGCGRPRPIHLRSEDTQ
jgi:hypothetical protein